MSSIWYYNEIILEKCPGDAPKCQAVTFSFLGHKKVQKLPEYPWSLGPKAAEDSEYLLSGWKIFYYFTNRYTSAEQLHISRRYICQWINYKGGSWRDDRHRHHIRVEVIWGGRCRVGMGRAGLSATFSRTEDGPTRDTWCGDTKVCITADLPLS